MEDNKQVKIGQVYIDNDWRAGGRKVCVVEFDGGDYVIVQNVVTERETRVLAKRLLSGGDTGYTLQVEE